MSLLWVDGFEGYGSTPGATPAPSGILARRYSSVGYESYMNIEAGRISGYGLRFDNSSSLMYTPTLNTDATIIVGLAVKLTSTSTSYFLALYDGGTLGVNLGWAPGGELCLKCGASTILGTTSGLGFMTGAWYWIELKILVNSTTGTYELRVGGVDVLSDTGVNTQQGAHTYYDAVKFGATSLDPYFDDFYICNGAGSINNDFLGNVHILAIFPDGDGASSDWTPNTVNNYEGVDETVADGDTTYVESNTVNHVDLYTYADLPALNIVRGIQINTDCRETSANSYNLITEIRSGGNTYDDTEQLIGTTSYVTKRRISELDPNTANTWLYGDINSAEFGIKVS